MKKIKFDDFVRLNRGFDLPDSDVIDGPYPVVASTSIKTYHNEYKVDPPVVVTGRSGSLGKVQYIDEKCWPLNTSLYSKDFRGNYPLYVYYYLQLMHLEQYNAGVGVPTLNQNHLHGLKIFVHDRREQEKVANKLHLYDQAIENNNKRIKILEQMAENLYKEWFVRFRFPGHEDVEFIAGKPKDWKLIKLEDIISIDRGLSYSSDEIDCEVGTDLINLKNIRAFGGFRIDGTKKYSGNYKEQQVVHRGDLVMGVTDMTQDRRTVGAVALIPVIHNTSVVSADLIKISSKLNNVFLFCMFKYGGLSKHISQFANGANVLHLRPQVVNRVKVFMPTDDVIELFSKIAQPLFDEMDYLNEKNDNLIKQRDLLLPRLMSGKLEIM